MKDWDDQLKEIMRRVEEITAVHPAAAYLPCFYRAGPPRVFLLRHAVRVLVKNNGDGLEYEHFRYYPQRRGFREVDRGLFHLSYVFSPGKEYELELEGVLLEKRLHGGDLAAEVWEIREGLGFERIIPVTAFRKVRGADEVVMRLKRLDPDIELPSYAHPGDAGMDVRSARDMVIEPGEWALVPTGFCMALPEGYAAFVHPRSGLAARHGVSIVNSPGTIDCHYRGEVKVILVNLGGEPFRIKRGDRIAQVVVQRVERVALEEVGELDETPRGDGGFGSTGL